MLFQQDGSTSAFAHSSTGETSCIETFCGNRFEEDALSVGYLVLLILKPDDFFFWRCIKNAVYIPSLHTNRSVEVAGRMRDAAAAVTPTMPTSVCTEL
jgi:hypothetical protein